MYSENIFLWITNFILHLQLILLHSYAYYLLHFNDQMFNYHSINYYYHMILLKAMLLHKYQVYDSVYRKVPVVGSLNFEYTYWSQSQTISTLKIWSIWDFTYFLIFNTSLEGVWRIWCKNNIFYVKIRLWIAYNYANIVQIFTMHILRKCWFPLIHVKVKENIRKFGKMWWLITLACFPSHNALFQSHNASLCKLW